MTSPRIVSRAEPCLVCGATAKCSRKADGLIFCWRKSGPQAGFRMGLPCRGNPQCSIYRTADDPIKPTGMMVQAGRVPPTNFSSAPSPKKVSKGKNWRRIAERYADNMTPGRRKRLADSLELPIECLDALPLIGYNEEENAYNARHHYTFPEVDAQNNVVGIVIRSIGKDVKKWVMPGCHRGLYITVGWQDHIGPIRIVEGATDVLALASMDVPVIGRHSAMGGAEMLVELLRGTNREIHVLQENDKKDNGLWPGKQGAEFIVSKLKDAGIKAVVAPIESEFKDAREYVICRNKMLSA